MKKNLFKKILAGGAISLILGFSQTGFASAASCRTVLGIKSWDCNVSTNITSDAEIPGMVASIAANVAEDAAVIATYLAMGFIIYGGYLYMFSYGDPGKAASGKKTLTTAFIGLAITLLAKVIFSTIRLALSSNSSSTEIPDVDPDVAFVSALQWVVSIAGIVAAIFVVYGGISYATSTGDPGKLTKAKNAIFNALIGLAIVGLAEVILMFVSKTINDSVAINIEKESICLINNRHEES